MDLSANVDRFSGFADCYDAYRPQPPSVVVDILTQLARVKEPGLVVDLGSGTGLATRIWAGRAKEVVGVEPSADMRRQAEAATEAADLGNIRYVEGLSSEIGLPDGCADIVTASQALHWMEPESTFAEVSRILRPGGVFAAIDCDWPPVMNWEAEEAYRAFSAQTGALERQHGVTDTVTRWSKGEHLARIQSSGRFRYTREILVHNIESGNADRLVGLAMSFGSVEDLLKRGLSEEEIGLDKLRAAARRIIGDQPIPWYFGYRVRIGVR